MWRTGMWGSQKTGGVFLPDTVKGRGHTSEVLEGPVQMVFIPVPAEVDIRGWRAS